MILLRISTVLLLAAAGCHGSVVLDAGSATDGDGSDLAGDPAGETPSWDIPSEPDAVADPPLDSEPREDAPAGGAVGDPCNVHSDCDGVPGEGRMCATELLGLCPFPGGYCSAVCTSDSECGVDGACLDVIGLDRYCFRRCARDEDCRLSESHRCDRMLDTESPTVCMPPSGCMPTPEG